MYTFFRKIAFVMMTALLLGTTYLSNVALASGETPGSYVNYSLGTGTYTQVTFSQRLETDPGRANIFWAHQFAFKNNDVAYTGFQTFKDGGGMFIFSAWNATGAIPGVEGSYCVKFSEDGTGYSCRYNVRPIPHHTYKFVLSDRGNGYYGVKVYNITIGTIFDLGQLQVGTGNAIKGNISSWTEYFDWNDASTRCTDSPYSTMKVEAPTTNNGTVEAKLISTNTSTTCASYTKLHVTGTSAVHENGIGNSYAGRLVNANSGLCADVRNNSSAPGTPVDQYTCHTNSNQVFVFASDGTLHTQNGCLGTSGASTDNGANVELQVCNNSTNQQWSKQSDGTIQHSSGRVLDVPGFSTSTGTGLVIWDHNGGANQKWSFNK
ncbi:ricin-type beta-trefoil lectin domain protein [Paenibacillus sp. YYML68]|uniref:RICIN domain-containing protein n=1 Tax=Paenibacillus sp. YYML68 TaxID=2909250 RepID=UPI0024927504|nr:ricin-type beta-trefoil lectin domain protein [Paenibacillus sp. YYML68]